MDLPDHELCTGEYKDKSEPVSTQPDRCYSLGRIISIIHILITRGGL
jgi:hypothetical protein